MWWARPSPSTAVWRWRNWACSRSPTAGCIFDEPRYVDHRWRGTSCHQPGGGAAEPRCSGLDPAPSAILLRAAQGALGLATNEHERTRIAEVARDHGPAPARSCPFVFVRGSKNSACGAHKVRKAGARHLLMQGGRWRSCASIRRILRYQGRRFRRAAPRPSCPSPPSPASRKAGLATSSRGKHGFGATALSVAGVSITLQVKCSADHRGCDRPWSESTIWGDDR
jgi:hypothetical protein